MTTRAARSEPWTRWITPRPRAYDAIGQLVSETDANGNTWTYTYDKDGRQASQTDPLGNTTTYTYDAVGNLLTSTTALGRTTSYTYDARNRQTSETDPMGHVITFYYDALGRLVGTDNKDGTHVSTPPSRKRKRPAIADRFSLFYKTFFIEKLNSSSSKCTWWKSHFILLLRQCTDIRPPIL